MSCFLSYWGLRPWTPLGDFRPPGPLNFAPTSDPPSSFRLIPTLTIGTCMEHDGTTFSPEHLSWKPQSTALPTDDMMMIIASHVYQYDRLKKLAR